MLVKDLSTHQKINYRSWLYYCENKVKCYRHELDPEKTWRIENPISTDTAFISFPKKARHKFIHKP